MTRSLRPIDEVIEVHHMKSINRVMLVSRLRGDYRVMYIDPRGMTGGRMRTFLTEKAMREFVDIELRLERNAE